MCGWVRCWAYTDKPGGNRVYLRAEISASNNEAKNEALIVGLRIAAQMGVQNVHVSVDSKLVANQVLGMYVAKEENMIKYLDKVKSLVSGFTNFFISQVPQSKNKKADALSKIALTSFTHLSKQAVVPYAVVKMCWTTPGGPLTPITAPWPFYKWGIDIAGPFSEGPSKVKFLIVAMDYFTKWIEAKAVATITGSQNDANGAAIHEAKDKLKMTKYYNARVCGVTFRLGDFVYRSNDASHAVEGGKLGPK
nr:reverse transcriptase domain-containing protein [Tanacetum cinerariifolium]